MEGTGKHIGTPKPSYTVERRGPYGFWHIFQSRGRMPDALRQQFTYSSAAVQAIEQYDREAEIKVKY